MSLRLTGGHDGRNLQEVGDSVSPKRNQLYASYQTREACAYLTFRRLYWEVERKILRRVLEAILSWMHVAVFASTIIFNELYKSLLSRSQWQHFPCARRNACCGIRSRWAELLHKLLPSAQVRILYPSAWKIRLKRFTCRGRSSEGDFTYLRIYFQTPGQVVGK